MPASYEAEYHVEQARLRGGIPETDSRFTQERMLSLLTAEMQGAIAPMVHAAKSEHGVVSYSAPVQPETQRVALPPAAFANTLRDVFWIASDDKAYPLEPLSAADSRVYTFRGLKGDRPLYYVLQGSTVVLYPIPTVAGTLAMPYYARPSDLVPSSDTAKVISTNGAGVLVVDSASIPIAIQAGPPTLDVVRGTPGFETLVSAGTYTVQPDSPSGGVTTFTFAVTPGQEPSAGDYICLTGQSPVPQIPVELFPLLHARVAYVAVPSTGDTSDAANALSRQVAELTARGTDFLKPRVESASPEVGRGMGSNPMLSGVVRGSYSWG